jgi:hypothetical protein
MTNPITQQIRDARRRLAAKFDNDLDQIVDDLQRQQRESGLQYVDRSKRATNHDMHGRTACGAPQIDDQSSVPRDV